MLKKYECYQKTGVIFLLCLAFLVGCANNNGQEELNNEMISSEIEDNQEGENNEDNEVTNREISGTVMELQEDKMRIIENKILEVDELEIDGVTMSGMQWDTPEEEWITVFFTEKTVVEIVEMINADWENPIESQGTISDISEHDSVEIHGHGEGKEFFVDKIVINRVTFTVSE